MQLDPMQQQKAAQEINKRLERVTLSWNNDLREWHPLALKALEFASCALLQVPQNKYRELLKTDTHGINANVAALLANNLEARSPKELDVTIEEYVNILELNQRVADHWEALVAPIRQTVLKEFELQAAAPKIHTIDKV
ncbi:MAG: hypothetical protein LC112_13965 [Flavobacteriales bacterium]|nr:hypothetical protein [Flavobacteriales bacterium]